MMHARPTEGVRRVETTDPTELPILAEFTLRGFRAGLLVVYYPWSPLYIRVPFILLDCRLRDWP